MQTFVWYLLQVNIILLVLGLVYAFLLKKETFYQLNRLILGAIIAVAFLLPLSPAPNWVAAANTQLIEVFPIESPPHQPISIAPKEIEKAPLVLEETSKDKVNHQPVTDYSEKSVHSPTALTNPSTSASLAQPSLWSPMIWLSLYGFIFSIFLLRFLSRMMALSRVIGNGEQVSSSLIYSKHPISPFSFGNFIVLNPHQYQPNMLEQIIQHERVHVQQWHTLDIMVAEFLTIVCWFNPMSWWMSKTIRLNLEYIADAAVLQSGVQRKSYQYNLLKISHPEYQIQLANNFNHSLLKNRIIMMNTKKSPFLKLWKYTLLLPLVFILLLGVNISTAQKSTKTSVESQPKIAVYDFKDNPSFKAEDRSIYENEALASEAESLEEERALEAAVIAEEARENAAEVYDENDETHDGIESDILGDLDDFSAGKEDVFVVIRPGLERTDFKVIANQLKARGVTARFDNQNYNDGKLTQIRFRAKVGNQQFEQQTNFEDDQPLIFYITRANKADMVIGIPKDTSPKAKDLIQRVTGIFFITDDKAEDDVMTYGKYEFKKGDNKDTASNIYVVITQQTTEAELAQIKKDLAKAGLFMDIQLIDVNEHGIETIQIKATDHAGFNGHVSASFDKHSTDGMLYLYRYNGKAGMGHGNQLEYNKNIPDRMKKILKGTTKSKIGSFREE